MMRTEIVVGADTSPGSTAALAWALDDASRRGARVRAVLAWADDSRPAQVDAIATSPRLEDLAAAADTVLRRQIAVARSVSIGGAHPKPNGTRVPVDERTVYSTAAHALLQESLDAGMLVVGTGRPHASRWALLGSVGDTCAQEAPIPLVVVPSNTGRAPSRHRTEKSVLVGVDGSRASAIAARWAAREAALRGVPLRVLHVTGPRRAAPSQGRVRMTIPLVTHTPGPPYASVGVPTATGGGPHGCGRAPVGAARTGAAVDALDLVRLIVAEVRTVPDAPLVETISVTGGTAATLLLEAAGDAQLLVLGARGAGGFPALSLGSTAHHCLARVSCPTAIIRGHEH